MKNNKIEISVGDYVKAKEVLTDNHISILKESSEYKTLEDYYFEIVEGAMND